MSQSPPATRIFVTVGTHEFPFDRLVAAADALARAGHVVVVQTGTSGVHAPHCQAAPTLSPDAMQQALGMGGPVGDDFEPIDEEPIEALPEPGLD